MKRVTGLGGFFFKAKNAKKLQEWYRKHLGLPLDPQWGGWQFHWREARNPKKKGYTVWSAFDADTDYFKPSKKPFMFNFRVTSLRRTLTALKKQGVRVDPKAEESAYGKFGWIMDPEATASNSGNRRSEHGHPAAHDRHKRTGSSAGRLAYVGMIAAAGRVFPRARTRSRTTPR